MDWTSPTRSRLRGIRRLPVVLPAVAWLWASLPAAGTEASGIDLAALEPFAASPAALLAAANAEAAAETEEDRNGIFLVKRHRYDILESGGSQTSLHYVYRPGTEGGVMMNERIEAPWIPDIEMRPAIKARVVTADGHEHWLDAATIAERSPQDVFGLSIGDGRSLVAPLPHFAVGAVVEVEITGGRHAPYFRSGDAEAWALFAYSAPIRHLDIRVTAPVGLPLIHRVYAARDVTRDESELDGRQILTLTRRNVSSLSAYETSTPRDLRVLPAAIVTTEQTWEDAAAEYRAIVETRLQDDVGPLLAGIVPEGADRETTIRTLVEWLDEKVRYTAVNFGRGRIEPRTPLQTAARGYGDCKDKATLLVALLREAGIDAEVALLRAGTDADVDAELPGLFAFDHAIVYLPGPEPMWIDPTVTQTRPGFIPAAVQNRLALVVREGSGELTRTPAAGPEDNSIVVEQDIYVSETAPTEITESKVVSGTIEAADRRILLRLGNSMTEDELLEYFNGYDDSKQIVELDYSDPTDLSEPFRSRRKYRAQTVAKAFRDRIVLQPDALSVLDELPGELAWSALYDYDEESTGIAPRFSPLELGTPYSAVKTLRLHLPRGYVLDEEYGDFSKRIGPMRLERTLIREAETLYVLEYRFTTVKRVFSGLEAIAAATDVQALRDAKVETLVFHHAGERHLAASEIDAAVGEFRRLAELDPDNGVIVARLSRALMAVGLIDAGREYAWEAVRLSPDAYETQVTLGAALARNSVGFDFVAPYDAGAIEAALAKAHKIDATRIEAPWLLARLMELGSDGKYLGDDAAPNRALGYYRSLIGRVDPATLSDKMLNILLALERYDELEAVATLLPRTLSQDQLVLAAIAARSTADIADAVERLSPDRGGRAAVLRGAGYLNAYWYRYEPAAELYRMARRYSDDTVIDWALEVMASAEAHDDSAPPFSDAGALARAYLRTTLDRPRESIACYAPSIRDRSFAKQEVGFAIHEGRKAASDMSNSSMPRSVNLDAVMMSLRATVEGESETGIRVTVRGMTRHTASLYVVREGGGYWLLCRSSRSPMGEQALMHLETGNVDAARQWVRWAEDMTRNEWGYSATSEDPYGGDSFLTLMEAVDVDSAVDLRSLAVALVSLGDRSEEMLDELEILRSAAEDAALIRAYDVVLAEAFIASGRYGDLAESGLRMLAEAPESERGFRYAAMGLVKTGQLDALLELATERLAEAPDDWSGLNALASYHDARGEYALSLPIYRRMVDVGDSTADDLNSLVWTSILADAVDEEMLNLGREAARRSGYWNRAILHTLASAYAEAGMVEDAWRTLNSAMKLNRDPTPDTNDLYVLGRIADQLEFYDYARTAYGQVEPPADASLVPVSSYVLAQRALLNLPAGEDAVEPRIRPFGVSCASGRGAKGAVDAVLRAMLCPGDARAPAGGVGHEQGTSGP